MSFSVFALSAGEKKQAVAVMPQFCGEAGKPAEEGAAEV